MRIRSSTIACLWLAGICLVVVYQVRLLRLNGQAADAARDDPMSDWLLATDKAALQQGKEVECSNADHSQLRIPSFIIVGAQKGGTTALSAILDHHPRLQKSIQFEPHFFDRNAVFKRHFNKLHDPDTLCRVRDLYATTHFNTSYLASHPEVLAYEKTPSYMLEMDLIPGIKQLVPWAKIIVILRNPVDR
jgi:Sulfotransferase family